MSGLGAERQMGFFTDTTTCIGCKACEVACKQWNDLPADEQGFEQGVSYDHTGELSGSTWRHVRFIETLEPPDGLPDLVAMAMEHGYAGGGDGGSWLFMSDVCKHCTNAGCMDACPTGAIIRTEFATVIVQEDVCNGCGFCVAACPFGVVGRDLEDGRAAKCTLCYDRLQDGLEPACAKACPTDSIQFGPRDELQQIAERRVATLHERDVEGAYLYGAGEAPADEVAGGLGAFFLLTQPPEVYGLPAQAESPVQQNVVPATAAAVVAGAAAALGVAAAFLRAGATARPSTGARLRAFRYRRSL